MKNMNVKKTLIFLLMKFELENYHGLKSRFTCPACHKRHTFARYKGENGEYLSETVGRCNRESKCGYHKKPKEYFLENPQLSSDSRKKSKKTKKNAQIAIKAPTVFKLPDYIEPDILLRTLTNYSRNSFLNFLLKLFPEDTEAVLHAVKDYLIGTTKDGKTIFWQVDQSRKVRTGKIIAYDAMSGKRLKAIQPNWIHSELKKAGRLKDDFNLRQCFFGEHLLTRGKENTVAIVEAEKTAVIASICFSEYVWIAAGAKQNLNAEKLVRLQTEKIILYPDADGYEKWREMARNARLLGRAAEVSNLLEKHATDQQKAEGYDLADYLIDEQTRINRHNEFIDAHNRQIETGFASEQFSRLALGRES